MHWAMPESVAASEAFRVRKLRKASASMSPPPAPKPKSRIQITANPGAINRPSNPDVMLSARPQASPRWSFSRVISGISTRPGLLSREEVRRASFRPVRPKSLRRGGFPAAN